MTPPDGEMATSRPLIARWAWLALALGLLAAGIAVRVVVLDGRQMFKDEGASWIVASYGLPDLIAHAATDIHPPLYELLLRSWIGAFGDGLATMRALSVLIGIGVVLAAWRWGHEALGRNWGLLVLATAALSGLALEDAREVRFHVLEVLFATIAWWLIWRIARPGGTRRAGAEAVILAIAVAGQLWSSPMGIPTAGLQGLLALLLVAVRRDRATALVLGAIVVGGIAYLPWLPEQIGAVANGPPFWSEAPGPALLPYAFDTQLMGRGHTRVLPILAGLVLLAIAGLGILDLFIGRRRSAERRAHDRFLAWVVIAALALVPLAWLYSQVRSAWDVDYFGNILAALGIALAAGCRAIARRFGTRRREASVAIAAVVVLVLGVSSVQRLGQRLADEDLTPAREVYQAVAPIVGPDDLVLAADARSYFALSWLVDRRSDPLPLEARLASWAPTEDLIAIGQGLLSPDEQLDDAGIAAAGGWAGVVPGLANGGHVYLVDLEADEDPARFGPLERGELVEVGHSDVTHAGRTATIRELALP